MQAHEEEKGPKRRVSRRLGPRCVFFLFNFLGFIDNNGPKRRQTRRLGRFVGLSPCQSAAPHLPHPSLARTRPTKAHSSQEGQRRPTKRKKGPNDASRVVCALGVCFFHLIFSVLLTTTAPNDARRVVWVVS